VLTVRSAADAFLDSLGNANTVRNYGIGVGKTAERLGEDRPLDTVADDEIGGALEQLWGESAVNTWNAPAQEARERTALLPSRCGRGRRSHQSSRARRQQALTAVGPVWGRMRFHWG
jgi:hypothetical protein